MRESSLPQRIYDQLFSGLALTALIADEEIEEIARSLEDPEASCRESEPAFKAVAAALRTMKENP